MDLKRLEYFIQVAEAGSLTKAAVVLGVVQPALSRQIRILEQELGTALFIRTGRGVSLTDTGGELLRRSRVLIAESARIRDEIRTMAEQPSGQVSLGIPPTVSQVLAPPLIRHFATTYPNVALQIIEALSGHLNEWLSTGRIDVGVLYDAARTRKLYGEPLLIENLFLVCPPGSPHAIAEPLTVSALSRIPLILPGRMHGLRMRVEEALQKCGGKPRIAYEVDSMNAIREAVALGLGYTVLPSAAVHQEVVSKRLVLRELTDPPLRRTLLLVTSTQRPLSRTARTAAAAIKKEIHELVRSGAWIGTT